MVVTELQLVSLAVTLTVVNLVLVGLSASFGIKLYRALKRGTP